MDGTKVCNYCFVRKNYNMFRKDSRCNGGRRCKCKECEHPIRYQHYINNKEKYQQAYKEFFERNPNKRKEYNKKYYAKKRHDQI